MALLLCPTPLPNRSAIVLGLAWCRQDQDQSRQRSIRQPDQEANTYRYRPMQPVENKSTLAGDHKRRWTGPPAREPRSCDKPAKDRADAKAILHRSVPGMRPVPNARWRYIGLSVY